MSKFMVIVDSAKIDVEAFDFVCENGAILFQDLSKRNIAYFPASTVFKVWRYTEEEINNKVKKEADVKVSKKKNVK